MRELVNVEWNRIDQVIPKLQRLECLPLKYGSGKFLEGVGFCRKYFQMFPLMQILVDGSKFVPIQDDFTELRPRCDFRWELAQFLPGQIQSIDGLPQRSRFSCYFHRGEYGGLSPVIGLLASGEEAASQRDEDLQAA